MMTSTMMRRSLLSLVALIGCTFVARVTSAQAGKDEVRLLNGAFEPQPDPLAGWRFWSRSGAGGAEAARGDAARTGQAAARIRHTGEQDWAFYSEPLLPAKPGRRFAVAAQVRGSGHVELAVVALKGDQVLAWDVGSASRYATDEWSPLRALAEVPQGADHVRVRFVGTGDADLWVDDVTIEPAPPRSQVEKPQLAPLAAERHREYLDRALLATRLDGGRVYLSWRLLASDPADATFHVERRSGDGDAERITQRPVTRTTDFIDADALPGDVTYTVRGATPDGEPQDASAPALWTEPGRPYRSIALLDDATVQKAGIADLDGDGRLDFVLKTPDANVDPGVQYWKPSPGTYKLMAYRHDGEHLWTHDMGWAIEQGIWYSPYVVYDLDGDGRAEVALKAGEPGGADPRDADGKVTSGPEDLVVLDGLTGEDKARTPWPSREGFGDYNYYSRNQLAVAYLDGVTPAIIVERGTYRTIKAAAYRYADGVLSELWTWSDAEEGPAYRGQGAHCIRVADVDDDGRDEVILGSAVLDDNGQGLWSTRMGHPDQATVGDLDPSRPGLEISYGYETKQDRNGVCILDARTGEILWGLDRPSAHIHGQGLASDIDPRHPGVEVYGGERDDESARYLFSAVGELLSDSKDLGGLAPRAAFWDTDPQRELIRGGHPTDYETGQRHETKIDGSFVAVADLYGDWREEIITSLPGELRIYSTTIPATDRRVTLMQDPIYRLDVASASQGYYQMPSLSRLPRSDE